MDKVVETQWLDGRNGYDDEQRETHFMLRHGRVQLRPTMPHGHPNEPLFVCLAIRNFDDVMSSGNSLNLGCLRSKNDNNHVVPLLLLNVPYGPHQLLVEVFRQPYFVGEKHRWVASTVLSLYSSMTLAGGVVQDPSLCNKYNRHNKHHVRKSVNTTGSGINTGSTLPPLPPMEKAVTLVTLVHRGRRALANALETWERTGLLDAVASRVAYVQSRSDSDLNGRDDRVDLLRRYRFRVLGTELQVGIGVGVSRGIEGATTSHVLFLEEDFASRTTETVEDVRRSLIDVQSGSIDVVRLRSVERPGSPHCANVWKGVDVGKDGSAMSAINRLSLLDAAVVSEAFQDRAAVWTCGEKKMGLCAFSKDASWTNNPFLTSRRWFLRHIASIAAIDPTRTLEAAISFTPFAWSRQCFVISQSMSRNGGGFTHEDLDKKQYEQTVCPEIIKTKWEERSNTAGRRRLGNEASKINFVL